MVNFKLLTFRSKVSSFKFCGPSALSSSLFRTSSIAASPRTTFTMDPNSGHVNNGSKCCPHNECFNQWLRDNTTVTTNILLGFFNPSFKFFCVHRMDLICDQLQIMFRFFYDSVQYKWYVVSNMIMKWQTFNNCIFHDWNSSINGTDN